MQYGELGVLPAVRLYCVVVRWMVGPQTVSLSVWLFSSGAPIEHFYNCPFIPRDGWDVPPGQEAEPYSEPTVGYPSQLSRTGLA